MPAKTQPKVQSAAQFVMGGINAGRFKPGEFLPSIRMLAAEAKVSFVTMWKAVNRLKKQSHLIGKSGEAPRVAGWPIGEKRSIAEYVWPTPSAADGRTARNRLTARIRKDILQGRYQPGVPLPHLKQLEAQYRTSTRSLQRVLTGLCAEGVLEAGGRGFAVPRFPSGIDGTAIGFLAYEEYLEHYNLGIPQGHDYIRDTQLYASQAGVRLIVEPYHRSNESILCVDSSSLLFSKDQSPNILGYIYVLSEDQGLDPLLRKLAGQNRPLVILEQGGYWQFPAWIRRCPVMVIPVGITTACGEDVGRFLLSLGHTRIAYFSPYHSGIWSVSRLKGLSAAFEQAGLPGAVLPCVINYDTWFGDKNFQGDPSSVPRLKLEWPAKYESPALRREATIMQAMFHAKLDSQIVARNALQDLFEQTLKDKHITAWVGANDQIAVFILEFLRKCGVKVPQDISVASFDDSFHAHAYQLTSYNFNIPAIVSAALQHILRSQTSPQARRAKIVHIDGVVVKRQTAGLAPRV